MRGGGESRAGNRRMLSSAALAAHSPPLKSGLAGFLNSLPSRSSSRPLLWLWSLFLEEFPPDIHVAHFLLSVSFLRFSKILFMEKLPRPCHRQLMFSFALPLTRLLFSGSSELCFSNCSVRESHAGSGGPIQMQIMIHWVWGGA